MPGGEHFQVRSTGHGAVVVEYLHDHRRRGKTGQACQVATRFGMAGAVQHTAFAGA
ncbi:hypothetical protein D3C79_1050300 [compost metagenome]